MRPYGRIKHVTGGNNWKLDYRLHKNGRKLENWWEDICCYLPRTTVKKLWKKDIDVELNE